MKRQLTTKATAPRPASDRVLLSVPSVTWAFLSLAVAAYSAPADAALTQQFQGKVSVDVEWLDGVSGPTDIAFHPDGRALITRKTGQVVVRQADGTTSVVQGAFGTVNTQSERGLLGVVADPNVAENDTFYFYVSNGTDPAGDFHRVVKAVLTDQNTLTVDATPVIGASRNLGPGLQSNGPFQNHNGGGLVIHKGHLYVGVGDTGFNTNTPSNKFASCLNKGNGKILRVNLDGTIPEDNPLVGVSSVTSCDAQDKGDFATAAPDQRIFNWGLRNPWRFWIDPTTDSLWIGDVGEVTEEEISVGKGGGNHFGYPFEEGAKTWNNFNGKTCADLTPSKPCTKPVHSYPTPGKGGGGFQGSVTGGLIPTGCGWDEALGGVSYVFGDYVKNWIRALRVNETRDGITGQALDFETFNSDTGPVSFRQGPDAALYVVMYAANAVYKYSPTDTTGCEPGGAGGSGAGGSSSTAGAPASTAGRGAVPTGGAFNTGGSGGASPPSAGAATGGASVGSGGRSSVAGAPAAGAPTTLGGAPSAAGTLGASGSSSPSGPTPSSSDEKSGCGCRVAGIPDNATLSALLVGGFAAGTWLRKRRRRRR